MTSLRDVVQSLASRDGVRAVVVVSGDGLPIDHAVRNGLDADAVAALLPAVAQHAAQLGAATHSGDLSTAVLEFGNGYAVVSPLGESNQLFIMLAPDTNIGALLYDLRRHRPAITKLL